MLAQILSPVSPAQFFSDYWERRPLVIARGDPAYYGSLLTLGEVDALLASDSTHHPDIKLVQGDMKISSDDYTLADGRIDALAAAKLFRDGATIVASAMHRRFPRLGELCRDLEQELSIPFQANLYLTPPDAQGFKIHYDTHDVFILQVAGSKEWRLYGSPLRLPLKGQEHTISGLAPDRETHRFMLQQGDVAYIPRGFFHDAVAKGGISLHITLGALSFTWADVMIEAVAAACLADVELRRALPVGFANPTFDRASAAQSFHSSHSSAVAASLDVLGALSAIASAFVHDHSPDFRGKLMREFETDSVGPETVIQTRPGLVFQWSSTDQSVVIAHHNVTVTFPLHVESALEQMLSGATVQISSVRSALSGEGIITLAKRLIREGFIYTVGVEGVRTLNAFGPINARAEEQRTANRRPARKRPSSTALRVPGVENKSTRPSR